MQNFQLQIYYSILPESPESLVFYSKHLFYRPRQHFQHEVHTNIDIKQKNNQVDNLHEHRGE